VKGNEVDNGLKLGSSTKEWHDTERISVGTVYNPRKERKKRRKERQAQGNMF